MPSFERVENPLSGLSASFLQSAVCIICLQEADKFHTCSLRCILRQVHALTQNALTLFSADAENSAKLFLQSERRAFALLFPWVKKQICYR